MTFEPDESRSNREHLIDHLCRLFAGVWRVTLADGREKRVFGDWNDALITITPDEISELSAEAYSELVENDPFTKYAREYFDRSAQLVQTHDEIGAPGIYEDQAEAREALLSKLRARFGEDSLLEETIRKRSSDLFTPTAQITSLDAELRSYFEDYGPPDLDLIFTFEFLMRLDQMVERAKHDLEKRHLLWGVPDRVNEYMGEAARVFRNGFDKACIAMCRSALEEALRHHIVEHYGKQYLQVSDESFKGGEAGLQSMIIFAFDTKKFLHHSLRDSADTIRIEGNRILHGKYSEGELENYAREILFSTRLILSHLFRSRTAGSR